MYVIEFIPQSQQKAKTTVKLFREGHAPLHAKDLYCVDLEKKSRRL